MTTAQLRQTVLDLPTKDRQELAEALWESLETEAVALPAWQIRLIDSRLADLEKNPEEGSSWRDVERRQVIAILHEARDPDLWQERSEK